MSHRILLAIPPSEHEVIEQARAVLEGTDGVVAVEVAGTSSEVTAAISEAHIDIVVLHEHLGPVPVLELGAELNRRHPDVGLVLIAEENTPELMRSAMFSGVRGVVTLPLGVEDLTGAVASAGEWATAVRDRLGDDGAGRSRRFGKVVCLAGAKGGVGTTTLSVLLAERLAAARPDRAVCLVDLDLQSGDVRSLLDISHRRSILDLTAVVDELSTRHLDEALFPHADGFQVLLPPVEGELAEDVDGLVVRRVLARLRARFDVVVVDLGSVMTEATATVAEMADAPIVVTQTDVPSLRGANRLLAMWERVAIPRDNVRALVNRVDRDTEIQPDLCGRVVKAPLLQTTVPARFRDLEVGANTGQPLRVQGPVLRAVDDLIDELGLTGDAETSATPAPEATSLEARVLDGERGQAAVDFIAALPLLMMALLLMWQLALAGWTQVMVQNAAREGARQLAVSEQVDATGDGVYDDVGTAVIHRLPEGWRSTVEIRQGGDWVQVEVGIPVLMPGFNTVGTMESRSGAVLEEAREP